jgi:hypothetical protein
MTVLAIIAAGWVAGAIWLLVEAAHAPEGE